MNTSQTVSFSSCPDLFITVIIIVVFIVVFVVVGGGGDGDSHRQSFEGIAVLEQKRKF